MKYYLVGDIGGTNPRLAIIDENNKLIEKRVINHQIDFSSQVNDFLKECGTKNITTNTFCISAAGPIKGNTCHLTNANLTINTEEIKNNSLLSNIHLINDFVAIGYAINLHNEIPIKNGIPSNNTKIIVGIGTGLGCCLIAKNQVLPTEAGFLELKHKFSKTKNSHIEETLSGKGLQKIYKSIHNKTIPPQKAIKDIKTKKEFTKMLSKLLQNLFFAYLPTGGIYLAGGILQKNPELLNKDFIKQFEKHYDADLQELLIQTPVYLIKDYDISLYGCKKYIDLQNHSISE